MKLIKSEGNVVPIAKHLREFLVLYCLGFSPCSFLLIKNILYLTSQVSAK